MSNFTPRAQQVLNLARKEAERFNHAYVGTEHLLLGLIKLGQGVAINVLQRMGLDMETVCDTIEKQLGGLSDDTQMQGDGQPAYTARVKEVLALSAAEAKALGHSYVGTEHMLLGLIKEGRGVAAKVLSALGVDLERCRNEMLAELDPHFMPEGDGSVSFSVIKPAEPDEVNAGGGGSGRSRELKTPALKAFGRDLTEMAQKGELDPVIGRQKEIERVIQVLCRRTKNNPVLIGEAGVGKTAIVEGLAQEIASGVVPEIIADKRVVTLDLALMIAGTKYRGQFEERLKAVIDEICKAKNIIVFIDELHTIVGAGAAEGAMDASNIVKPALSRGELQCIGATTLAEYRKHIEKDNALERRFQSVKVEEPSIDDTIRILAGIRQKYEEHHQVRFTEDALESAAKLSGRYITNRLLPDKAIDVLDEAASKARLKAMAPPHAIESLTRKIETVCQKKEEAVEMQDFEKAAQLRDEEKKARAELEELTQKWKKNRAASEIVVDEEKIRQIIADWTGVPIVRIEQKESERLLELEKEIQKSVVGQEEATELIARALRRSRTNLKDPRRPIGSFLFMGPTGVGKTHLAKTLALQMFGSKDSIIQMDMSEYMEKFTMSRLVGSPPGYIGHDEGGQLTESVRRNPYSLVLFDEIEKAHPDVIQLLLQILEEGRLTDSLGRTVDFRNTIIIMTSNVGAELLQKGSSIGFGSNDVKDDIEKIKGKMQDEMKKVFKPEFLNRVDETVLFRALTKEHMSQIVDIEIRELCDRLKENDMEIKLTPSAKNFLIDHGYDEKFGARPLRRTIKRYLEDSLAEELLRGNIEKNKLISVKAAKDKLVFSQPATKAVAKKA